jgi:hypothetical protein
MAQISLFKELLKQVTCEAIPNIGFTQDDLDRVKTCVDQVKPTETEDFSPNIQFDQNQVNQADCIAGGTEEVKRIIVEEQRKLPNAIRYAALRGKVQELRDNAIPIKTYFEARLNFFTTVIEGTVSYTSEYLYWESEYLRINEAIDIAGESAIAAHKTNLRLTKFINLILDNLDDIKIASSEIRATFLSLTDTLSNLSNFLTELGVPNPNRILYSNATTILDSPKVLELIQLAKAKSIAYSSRLVAKANAIKAQSDRIQSLPALPEIVSDTQNLIQAEFSKISTQLTAKFIDSAQTTSQPIVPIRTLGVKFRLINKSFDQVRLPLFNDQGPQVDGNGNAAFVDESVQIEGSSVLSTNVFRDRQGFSIEGISAYRENSSSNPPREESDYTVLRGLLYNGISENSYFGLYRKLSKPIKYLFTLEDRGLTVDANKIDPELKGIQDAPTSIKEDETTFFIQNLAAYESFYDTLPTLYPVKAQQEREIVYPNQIRSALASLTSLAKREAADFLRADPLSPLKLARPTSYTQSSGSAGISQGTFTYSDIDSALSDKLLYYTRSYEEINQLISECDSELEKLDELIKENSMDETVISRKIKDIPCFKKAGDAADSINGANAADSINGANAESGQTDCEKDVLTKLATDPLYLRTLSGNNPGLPDITSQCYWKYFAKALNKVCLFPFPDLINIGFRYWPITCFIPSPFGIALLPIPPRWKPLFVIPTPLGTLVCFLTMPLAPIGIPLPSVYLYFFAIDGNKYLAFAPNVPILYSPIQNLKIGFELDNSSASVNPLGLSPTNPYKGQPIKGSLTVPLSVTALSSKSSRLASLAAMIATGELTLSNLAGEILPVTPTIPNLLSDLTSEAETMLAIANASPVDDFKRQMVEFKKTLNRQLDKLGDMQTSAIDSIRRKVYEIREDAEDRAFNEEEPSERRKKRERARDIQPISITEKIDAVVNSITTHIDNIKLGTIRYPKDATKFNPELPSAITAIFDVIEMAATGDLKIDDSALSLNSQLSRILKKIDISRLTDQTQFDLSNNADFIKFKNALKDLSKQSVDYLKGSNFNPNVKNAKDQQEANDIAESELLIQETLSKALSLTALALSGPISINIFDLGKKCCEIQSTDLFSGLPPELALAFSLITAILEALIDGLDPESIVNSLGLVDSFVVSLDDVANMLENTLSVIPNVPLPGPAGLIQLTLALVIPVLSIISLPKAPTPLHLPTIPIIIPLDPILKPLIKAAIASIIEALFKLLEQAGNSIFAAEIDAANAASQANLTTQIVGQTQAGGMSTQPLTQNTVNSGPGETIVKNAFETACTGGITAALSLESRIEIIRQINTIKSTDQASAASGNQSTSQTVETITPTSSSKAIFSISLPNGLKFDLPELPFVSLDILGYFHLLTSADLIELIRSIVNSIFEQLIEPIVDIVSLISRLSISLNTYSYTTIEAGIPQISIIKLILLAIDSLIPPGFKLKPINLDVLKIVQSVAIPALELAEPVLKEIAWLGSLALCAISPPPTYSGVSIARLFHPIMNQDDLPPWERLTHKNPLFAIFLDEIAWRGSIYSTGSLIFQTKTPALIPYTPIFPIVHVSPHLT